MAIMRVLDGEKFIGDIEAETVPSIGDTFWWKTNGPYVVQDRTWHLPDGFMEENPFVVTLHVSEMPK